jgi:hypothetical protein
MLKVKLLSWVGAIALIGTAVGCSLKAPTSTPESGSAISSLGGRSAFSELPLPPENQRVGTDPEQIALDNFGMAEPGEGNFNQEVMVVEQTSTDAIVTVTQTGVPDDSVEGIRYWLEFDAQENQWALVWSGRQVRCRPNRGSQEWSTELCS